MRKKHNIKDIFRLSAGAILGLALCGAHAAQLPMPEYSGPNTGYTFPAAFTAFDLSSVATNLPANAATPQVSEWTRINQPGDTMVISAETLSTFSGDEEGRQTAFAYYGPNVLDMGRIQRLDGQQCSVTLPETLPVDEMYYMWPRNKNGYGKPVEINQTEAWWVGPDLVSKGETFSVFGRNLDLGSDGCYLYIEELNRWLSSSSANPCKADFVLPNDIANGTYTVWAHNGHGQEFGWAEPFSLDVANSISWNAGSITAASASYAHVMAAIDAAGDYYTVNIPAGTCVIPRDIHLPNRIWLKGAGQGKTIFKPAAVYEDSSYSGFALIDNGYAYNKGGVLAHFKEGKISDITFSQGDGTPELKHLLRMAGKRTYIENCTFSHTELTDGTLAGNSIISIGGSAYHSGENASEHIFVRGCTFNQGARVALGGKQVFYSGNFNNGMFDLGTLVKLGVGKEIAVTDGVAQDYDNSDYTSGYGWSQGRFFGGNGQVGASRNVYIGGNETIDMAPRYDYDEGFWGSDQAHQNAGEQIMFEALFTRYRGAVQSATANTFKCSGLLAEYDNLTAVIISGKGFGQSREVSTVNTATGTATITEDWLVQPDSSSVVMIGYFYSHFAVYGNMFDGVARTLGTDTRSTASAGVSFYGGFHNSVVAGNTMKEIETAMYNWSLVEDVGGTASRTVQPNYFNQFVDNHIESCMYGMSDQVYGGSLGDVTTGDVAIYGTVWRNNSFDQVTGSFLRTSGDNLNLYVKMIVYDQNTANSASTGLGYSIADHLVLTGNEIQGSGSGLTLNVAGHIPVLYENEFSGFSSRYTGNLPGAILEVPVRVVEVSEDSATTAVEVRNSGTDTLNWSASTDSSWLNITTASGAIDSEQGEAELAFEVDAAPADGAEAVVEVVADGQVQQMTVIYTADASIAPPPPVDPPAPVLTGITISGPARVNEQSSAHYTCTATYSDNSSDTVDADWSEDSVVAAIDSSGNLTTGDVTADEQVTVTAEYEEFSASTDVTISYVAPFLDHIEITGPTSVVEGESATYTCAAHYSDGSVLVINPAWSDNSSSATISVAGVLTAGDISADASISVSASFGGKTDSHAVTLNYIPPTLTGLTILGSFAVDEESGSQFSCVGSFSDGTTATVSPAWSENSTFASISSTGFFTATDVASSMSAVITASLSGMTVSRGVTITYIPPHVTGIEIAGYDSLNEEMTTQFTCESIYSDGSRQSIVPVWSIGSGAASIDASGTLTAGNIAADEIATVVATFDGKTDSFDIAILYVAPAVTGLSIAGPVALEEGASAAFTCTASYADGTTGVITPIWSESSSYASISAVGLLTAGDVASDQSVSITATINGIIANHALTVLYVAPPVTVTGISINAPTALNENTVETLTCIAIYSDGTTATVSPVWATDSDIASVDSSGALSVGNTFADTFVLVSASYGGQIATHSIGIWVMGNQIFYPLSGFEGKTVKARLWDEAAQEWIELGEMVSPEELVVENVAKDQWYMVSVEELNGATGEWNLVHTSWISM